MKRVREEEQGEPAKQVAGDHFVVSARSYLVCQHRNGAIHRDLP